MKEFTAVLNIHNSFDIITGRGKLLYKGAVAVYQPDFSVMLVNNRLTKADYPVIRNRGEILLPLQFFQAIFDDFYPDYIYHQGLNNIRIERRTKSGKEDKTVTPQEITKKQSADLLQERISFIIIDPGHGGKDPGAIGKGGVQEKGITLKIASHLEDYLKKNLKDIKIKSTRYSDTFIELAKRTEIANKMLSRNENGILVSIHVNASILHSVSGFETYFLSQNPSNEEARATAALENDVIVLEENSGKRSYGDVEHVEAIMLTTQIQKESSSLANHIQKNMKRDIKQSVSKGVKKADFFVLRGSLMPAVLVEVGYISNTKELTRLKTSNYQKVIARGIGNGIIEFIKNYDKNNR